MVSGWRGFKSFIRFFTAQSQGSTAQGLVQFVNFTQHTAISKKSTKPELQLAERRYGMNHEQGRTVQQMETQLETHIPR
jgi:hypothetical protein